MRYIKNPVEVDAVQWIGNNNEEIQKFAGEYCDFLNEKFLFIFTPEGSVRTAVGDYIIKNSNGGFYSCDPNHFKAMYKPVN